MAFWPPWLAPWSSSAPSPPSSAAALRGGPSSFDEAHLLARDALAAALVADERGDAQAAVRRYEACKQACDAGLSAARPTLGKDAAKYDEMRKWRESVAERVAQLTGRAPAAPAAKRRPNAANAAAPPPPARARPAAPAQPQTARVPKTNNDAVADAVASMVVPPGSVGARLDDVKGLGGAKQALMEAVVLPTRRADLFTGIRAPHRGVLLYGPPGNGKTLLARALACESNATFFSVSAASLTSKYVGEGEKLMRALFETARARQPSVIFIDEADALLSARGAAEHDAMRRLKTEFLVQFDGLATGGGNEPSIVFVLAATNRPQDLDEAVRRRFPRRVHVPLPNAEARRHMLAMYTKGVHVALSKADADAIVRAMRGYSASDIRAVVVEASMAPLRELTPNEVERVRPEKLRAVCARDFAEALRAVRPTLTDEQRRAAEVEWSAAGFDVAPDSDL